MVFNTTFSSTNVFQLPVYRIEKDTCIDVYTTIYYDNLDNF